MSDYRTVGLSDCRIIGRIPFNNRGGIASKRNQIRTNRYTGTRTTNRYTGTRTTNRYTGTRTTNRYTGTRTTNRYTGTRTV